MRDPFLGRAQLFEDIVHRMRKAQDDRITEPKKAVEVVQKNYGLSEAEGDGILAALASGGNMTRLGLAQAITRFSQDTENYDRASELERLGGQVIELDGNDFERLLKKDVAA